MEMHSGQKVGRKVFVGEIGYHNAITEVRKFHKDHGKVPSSRDVSFGIIHQVNLGEYEKYIGGKTWYDFL